jgi:hypothetical protein
VVSSPVVGSVTPKQAFTAPDAMGGSIRAFCSGVPNTTTGLRPKMLRWTAVRPRHAGAGRRDGLHHDRRLGDAEAGAAVLLGMQMPSHPASAIARWKSCGKPPSRSACSQ